MLCEKASVGNFLEESQVNFWATLCLSRNEHCGSLRSLGFKLNNPKASKQAAH